MRAIDSAPWLPAQELLTFLQKHRPWLQNLLSDSLGKGLEGSAVQTKEAALLSSVIAALLKCCDPEVGRHQLLVVCADFASDCAILFLVYIGRLQLPS